MYDVIVIGQGPAGITAGIYAVRRELKTLLIGKEPGGQIVWAGDIENYPGFKSISNFDFIMRFNEHAQDAGVEMKNAEVTEIKKNDDDTFTVITGEEEYQAKAVIAAIGLAPRRLSVPGELELSGKGVSYCANCDGPLYKGKTVAVIGSGNSAFDAAEVLSKIAAKVYLIIRSDRFRAFDSLVDEVKSRENIEIITQANTSEIKGKDKVESLVYKDKDGNDVDLPLDGIFIEIGRIAHTEIVADFVDRDEGDQILVDANQATKTPGLYAAGDAVSSEFKQIPIATGQGTVAALAAYQYIQEKEMAKKK